MGDIQNFFSFFGGMYMDFQHWLMGLFIILSMVIAIATLIGKISEIIGKPVRWVKVRQLDHDSLQETQKELRDLAFRHEEDVKASEQHDKILQDKVDKLYKMFVDKQIDDMRWEILNFASSISANRQFSKDQYEHVLDTYEKYKVIIEKHGLTNGRTNASMNVIRERYQYLLKTGGFMEYGVKGNGGAGIGNYEEGGETYK